ncbi:hypothetical protein [Mycobacterium intracellulare]|uniref:hypothetical protein n=1 Tax=Mycobacterium intracellulare TaxID=1767 RepID=UPI0019286DC1|nr:hypothetical protein [Mycobacterium intracellulare]BCP29594.1 hypothetical protein MINTM026_05640 [Mycobacterium intracellulare]
MDIFFKFTKSARHHRIAKGRAREAMSNAVLVEIRISARGPMGIFVGTDSRDLELEIGIVGTDDDQVIWLVPHVMPREFRNK